MHARTNATNVNVSEQTKNSDKSQLSEKMERKNALEMSCKKQGVEGQETHPAEQRDVLVDEFAPASAFQGQNGASFGSVRKHLQHFPTGSIKYRGEKDKEKCMLIP